MFSKLWKDEDGIVALEYLLLATIVGLSLVVGFSAVSSALNAELVEVANAVLQVDQSFSYNGQSTCNAGAAGSAAVDTTDGITYGPTIEPAGASIAVTVCP